MTTAALLLFLGAVALCVSRGFPVWRALTFGLALFAALGLIRGEKPKQLLSCALRGGNASLVVLRTLVYVGFITGLWRSCGTVAFCVERGISLIAPRWFLLLAFLLTSLLSYCLGTTFGVTSTAGVILITLARSGGVNELAAAGAILSGVYFGDRSSPVSSGANLAAAVTGTELYTNVRWMLKTAALPMLLCVGIYGVLSGVYPLSAGNGALLAALRAAFRLDLWTLLPMAVILLLPVFRLPVRLAMAASAAAAFGVTVLRQGKDVLTTLRIALLGYQAEGEMAFALSGGGLVSMLSAMATVYLTSAFVGLLEEMEVFSPFSRWMERLSARTGLFAATALLGTFSLMVFCNQTTPYITTPRIMGEIYEKRGASRQELVIDIANSHVVIAGLIPWAISSSVPLGMLGVGKGAIPYACLLYLLPLCYGLTRPLFFGKRKKEKFA